MRNVCIGFVFVCVGWFAGAGHAQSIGEEAPDFEFREIKTERSEGGKTVKLQDFRGKILLLFFWKANDSGSVEHVSLMNRLSALPGVDVIGVSPEKREDVDRVATAKNVTFAYAWESNLHEHYDVSHFPRVYMIDPNGILVWRGHPAESEDKLKEQVRLTPPIGADAASLQAMAQLAAELLQKKAIGTAYTVATRLVSLSEGDSALSAAAKGLVTQIEDAARKRLGEARKLIEEKKHKPACEIIADLSVRLSGTDVGREADIEASRLRASLDTKAIMQKAFDEANAALAADSGEEHYRLKRYLAAIDALREVIDKYPQTDVAANCQKTIDRINNDSKIQETIRKQRDEEQADRWLGIADRFAKVEMYDEARTYYERIVGELPDTDAARRAKEKVAKLPKASKPVEKQKS